MSFAVWAFLSKLLFDGSNQCATVGCHIMCATHDIDWCLRWLLCMWMSYGDDDYADDGVDVDVGVVGVVVVIAMLAMACWTHELACAIELYV